MEHAPRVRSADDLTAEDTLLFEEESITSVVEKWNIQVVQHALDGTQRFLLGEVYETGKMHLRRNGGQAHILQSIPSRKIHKPDWCLYKKIQEGKSEFVKNLLPGDTKPANKLHSSGFKDTEYTELPAPLKSVICQLAKYMWLGETRYSYIITEEEIVALRFSWHKGHISTRGPADLESQYGGYLEPISGHQSNDNETRPNIEFCAVPWSSHGDNTLTVNLVLWWLSILAIRDPPIKRIGTYAHLEACNRESSPPPVADVTEKTSRRGRPRKVNLTSNKRRASDASPAVSSNAGSSGGYKLRNRRTGTPSEESGREGSALSDRTNYNLSFMSTSSQTSKRRRHR
ncbi:hypothetical protein F4808DRAFT_474158 [Astrocystis sublimbata]|nr:hypothetical protein F4808DRAFT_474158 [Astrocystis sublimbata]